jgi:hypothetical protein
MFALETGFHWILSPFEDGCVSEESPDMSKEFPSLGKGFHVCCDVVQWCDVDDGLGP